MRRLCILFAFGLLTCNGLMAQGESWTNKAGHALSAVPVEIRGSLVVFNKDGKSVSYPLSVFLPAEQKRLKTALAIETASDDQAVEQALMQRLLMRLKALHKEGKLSDEAYNDACDKARQGSRKPAPAPHPVTESGAERTHGQIRSASSPNPSSAPP